MDEKPAATLGWKKRTCFITLGVLVVLVALIGLLPTIVANSPLRDSLVNHALDDDDLSASTGAASFGWLSPMSLTQLGITRGNGTLKVDVDRVEVEKPLLSLLLSLPAIGTVRIDRPRTSIVLGDTLLDVTSEGEAEAASPDLPSSGPGATLRAAIRDGAIIVRSANSDEPVIEVENLSVTLGLQRAGAGRELVVDPVVLFDHQTLTPQLCDHGLQLVAPVLADATSVEGEISFELEEFRIPVGQPDQSERNRLLKISGNVQLHQVRGSLKNPLLREIAEFVSRLVGAKTPDAVRVLDNTRIDFDVRNGRVYHQGLAFVLPGVSEELVIRTSGTVGVDESIDLAVVVTLPSQMTAGVPVLRRLTQAPLELRVTGTLDAPKLAFPEGRDLLDEMAKRLAPAGQPGPQKSLPGAITDLVGGLVNSKDGRVDAESTAANILDLIRAARDEKEGKEETRP